MDQATEDALRAAAQTWLNAKDAQSKAASAYNDANMAQMDSFNAFVKLLNDSAETSFYADGIYFEYNGSSIKATLTPDLSNPSSPIQAPAGAP